MTSTISGPGDLVMLPPARTTPASSAIRREAVEEAVDVRDREPVREDQREQGQAGRGAHRGDVADVDRQRLVADVGERGEPQVEVDALDQGVGRQDVEFSPDAGRHGGVVADADLQRAGGSGKAVADPLDEAPFAYRCEQGRPAVNGRSQRHASRG